MTASLKSFFGRLFHRHVWISDLPLSLDGSYAILAGMWMPPATCKCGKKYPGINQPRDEWVDLKHGECWRLDL
jgi:hypothetical protein